MKLLLKITISILILIACTEKKEQKTEHKSNKDSKTKLATKDNLKLIDYSSSQEGDCYLSASKYRQENIVQIIDTFDCGDYGGEILKETYLNKQLQSFSYLTLEIDTSYYTKKHVIYNSKDSTLKTGIDTGKYLILVPIQQFKSKEKIGLNKANELLQKIKTTR